MDDMRVDWEGTTENGDELRVSLRGAADHVWGEEFARQSSLRQTETLGQTWDAVEWMGDSVLITGIDEDTTMQGLRTYVEQLISSTNESAARERTRLAAERARQESEQERRASHTSRLADDLRQSDG